MSFTRYNHVLRPAAIACFTLIALACSWFRVFDLYELATYDWRFQIRGERPVSKDIVLVEISDDAIASIGEWPFGRKYHSALIDVLHLHGAKIVAFDILFAEETADDILVADSAGIAGNVFFANAFASPHSERGVFHAAKPLAKLIKPFEDAGRGIGFVNGNADRDGKRRRVPPVIEYLGKPHYSLGIAVAAEVMGVWPDGIEFKPRHSVRVGGVSAPLDEDGYLIVNYAGRWMSTFRHYSYVDILSSQQQVESGGTPAIDLKELKDKICIIGFTATATTDTNANPIEPIYPMVGLHANVINSFLTNDFVHRAGRALNLAILLILAALVLVFANRYKPFVSLFCILGILFIFVATGVGFFATIGLWIDLFYPGIFVVLLYAVMIIRRMLAEMKKRELMEGELKVASQIQKSFLPESMPQEPGIEIAVFMRPAKAVGGDLYTFVKLDEGRLGVMAGDVSGKGTPAALFMAKVVSEFKFSARDHGNPSKVLESLNESIASESTGGLFVTLTYIVFDLVRRKMTVTNGGHLPVVSVLGGKQELVTSEEGMPIGVMPGVLFADAERPIADGDVFALYSDGVSEARNKKKDEYGMDRLQSMIFANQSGNAAEILGATVSDLERFMGKADQHDDITLIVVKIVPANAAGTS